MDRQSFLNLDIDKQIAFYNAELSKGKSFSKISKELGISKSISEKFKKHGYTVIDGVLQLESKSIQEEKETAPIQRSSRTIVIDTDLWKQLKIYSVVHDTTISEILELQAINFLKKINFK